MSKYCILVVMLLVLPLAMMSANAYLLPGQEFTALPPEGMVVAMNEGSGLGSTMLPSSLGQLSFSLPAFTAPVLPGTSSSAVTLPSMASYSSMGNFALPSMQGYQDQANSIKAIIPDFSKFMNFA